MYEEEEENENMIEEMENNEGCNQADDEHAGVDEDKEAYNEDMHEDNDLSEDKLVDEEKAVDDIVDIDEMVENNDDISMSGDDHNDVTNDAVEEENNNPGATAINEEGINDNMDNAAQRFGPRRSLCNARNTRYNFRNRYEREFQYMQKSVKIFVGLETLKGKQD